MPLLMAIVTFEVSDVWLPNWSSRATVTSGIVDAAGVVAGCWTKERWSAAPAVIVNAPLSVPVRAPSVAVSS